MDISLVTLDLDKLTRDLIEHYPNLHPPAAEVTIQGTLPHVQGKEAALTQVISNLLGNAAKFVQPGRVPANQYLGGEKAGARAPSGSRTTASALRPQDAEPNFFHVHARR